MKKTLLFILPLLSLLLSQFGLNTKNSNWIDTTKPDFLEVNTESHEYSYFTANTDTCRERDSLVLVAIYNATDGPNWIIPATRWNLSEPIDQWYGVKINANNCLVELLLIGIRGQLPFEIGDLKDLESLRVTSNTSLGDTIPKSLYTLTNLKSLTFNNTGIVDTISSDIGNLINLEILSITNNPFLSGSIPISIGNLSKLIILDLHFNQLSGEIPASIGNLTNVSFILDLSSNKLTGSIPIELSQLTLLEELDLSNNNLTGTIPTEIVQLTELNRLVLSDNNLEGCFPNELLNICSDISYISFANNPTLPWQGDFARFCSGEDQFGASCDDGNPNTANDIIQNDCSCAGETTPCISRDRAILEAIYTATDGDNWIRTDNWLSNAPLNEWYGIETNAAGCVVGIYLDNNSLMGTIPANLTELEDLEILSMEDNNLYGCFPEELLNTCSDVAYRFAYNSALPFSGLFIIPFCDGEGQFGAPCDDGNAVTVNDIIQNDCTCAGQLPCVSRDRAILEAIYNAADGVNWIRNDNWLTNTPLNEWYGIETNVAGCVVGIYLNNNNLTGPIPTNLTELEDLTSLAMAGNNLNGCFPEELPNICSDLFSYTFANNPALPWQGDFDRFCNGEDQLGISCDDGNPNTANDIIQNDCTCAGQLPCVSRDRAILEAIYNVTDGANWIRNDNWLTNSPLNEWYGIETNAVGCVVGIYLNNNNLTGPIPTNLIELEDLASLAMAGNNLNGCFSEDLLNSCVSVSYLFTNNPALPWEGYFNLFCNGEDQIGAPCDDGNSATTNDIIQGDCTCQGDITMPSCATEDFALLVAIFTATHGENWIRKANWLSNAPLSEWDGIETNASGCVTGIYLMDNQLNGYIPNDLLLLDSLIIVDMSGNQLIGCFPNDLASTCANINYNFTNNPALPWEGNHNPLCNGLAPIGAPCNDGNPVTNNDIIQGDCSCQGHIPCNGTTFNNGDISVAPPSPLITESVCNNCLLSGGTITPLAAPDGLSIEYFFQGAWSTSTPVYNQTQAISFQLRFACNAYAYLKGDPTPVITTNPGSCSNKVFTATGAIEQFTVPNGVTAITMIVTGADGGNDGTNNGGSGATAKAKFSVTPGEVLEVVVGITGASSTSSTIGGGGGGGSGVRRNSTIPLIIAGGGGGASNSIGIGGGNKHTLIGGGLFTGLIMATMGGDAFIGGKGVSLFEGAGGTFGAVGYDGGFGVGGGGAGNSVGAGGGGGSIGGPAGSVQYPAGGGGGAYYIDGSNISSSIIAGVNGGGTESNGSITFCYEISLCASTTIAGGNISGLLPPLPIINNSNCNAGGNTTIGTIQAPLNTCPTGTTLEYFLFPSGSWSATIPVYDQSQPITIKTRCVCDADASIIGLEGSLITTIPNPCCTGDTHVSETLSDKNHYSTGIQLTSDATIGAGSTISFTAGNSIILQAGFHAQATADFHAYIASCTPFTQGSNVEELRKVKFEKKITTLKKLPLEKENFKVTPNPSNGRIQIQYDLTRSQAVTLLLFDINGRLVEKLQDNQIGKKGINSIPYNTSNLSKGTYFVHLLGNKITAYEKIVVIE